MSNALHWIYSFILFRCIGASLVLSIIMLALNLTNVPISDRIDRIALAIVFAPIAVLGIVLGMSVIFHGLE